MYNCLDWDVLMICIYFDVLSLIIRVDAVVFGCNTSGLNCLGNEYTDGALNIEIVWII